MVDHDAMSCRRRRRDSASFTRRWRTRETRGAVWQRCTPLRIQTESIVYREGIDRHFRPRLVQRVFLYRTTAVSALCELIFRFGYYTSTVEKTTLDACSKTYQVPGIQYDRLVRPCLPHTVAVTFHSFAGARPCCVSILPQARALMLLRGRLHCDALMPSFYSAQARSGQEMFT